MKNKRELNKRQWNLYNLLKERSQNGLWTHNSLIQESLKEMYANTPNYKKSALERNIKRDIQIINDSDVIQKIILSSTRKGYKLATEEECHDKLEKERIYTLKKLKRIYRKMNKMSENGQTKITFTKYERDFIESFIYENDTI